MCSNNVNKKLVVNRFDELSCSASSTGKRPKAGIANFQHQGLTEKRNTENVKEGRVWWKLNLLAEYVEIRTEQDSTKSEKN